MHLGVRAVIAKTFARIHRANLVNWGILALEFADPADYDEVAVGDRLRMADVAGGLVVGTVVVENQTQGRRFAARCILTEREQEILRAGGRLAHTRQTGPAVIGTAPRS
jgi:aconitate hydratase